jgi:hypothetical protein
MVRRPTDRLKTQYNKSGDSFREKKQIGGPGLHPLLIIIRTRDAIPAPRRATRGETGDFVVGGRVGGREGAGVVAAVITPAAWGVVTEKDSFV